MYAAVIPNFISALLAGESPTIFGDGEQSRDFTYVDNVVDANLLAMNADSVAEHVYNVACGESATLNELVVSLNEIVGTNIEPLYSPPRTGDVKHSLADISRARADLDYTPTVSFREGLERTVEAIRSDPAQHADDLLSGV